MPDYNPFSLAGKTILVTGASSGIGRGTAIECSRMGARLIITGRNEERLQATLNELEGDGHVALTGDLAEPEALEAVVAQLPKLDGIVQCAGKLVTKPFKFAKRKYFDDLFSINFFAQVELLRLISSKKLLNEGSSVVWICSTGGTVSHVTGNMVYGSAKAALDSAMKYIAKELAPRTRINCICPAMIDTPLIHNDALSEEQLEADRQRYPMKRYGRPDDIAYAAIFLLSGASSWITGQDLIIDGGVTVH